MNNSRYSPQRQDYFLTAETARTGTHEQKRREELSDRVALLVSSRHGLPVEVEQDLYQKIHNYD